MFRYICRSVVLVCFVLLLLGCAYVTPTSKSSKSPEWPTPTPLPAASLVILPTATDWGSLITPLPTLDSADEQLMSTRIQSQDCILPCYLGITPGKTSLKEARKLLEELGAFMYRENRNDAQHILEYFYHLDVGGPDAPKESPTSTALVYQDLTISATSGDEPVQSIYLELRTENTAISIEKFREYWGIFSTQTVFARLGQPDHFLIDSKSTGNGIGSGVVMIYRRNGVLIQLEGTGHETSICSDKEATRIRMAIYMFSSSSSQMASTFNSYLDSSTYWVPVEEALGVDIQGFYRWVLTNPLICFMY